MLVIFDLDDTLIDTMGLLLPEKLKEVLHSLSNAGIHLLKPDDALQELLRLNAQAKNSLSAITEFLEINGFSLQYAEVAAEELQKDTLNEMRVLPFEGVNDVIQTLANDHKLAIVTAGNQDYQMKKIKLANLPERLFSKIIVCNSNEKGKYYEQLLQDFECASSDVIVCGDKIKQDLSPAKELGITTVHIRQGRGRIYNLSDCGVDYSIDCLQELLLIVKNIEQKNLLGSL